MEKQTSSLLPFGNRASQERLALLHLRAWWTVVTPDGVEKAEPCQLRAAGNRSTGQRGQYQLGSWALTLEPGATLPGTPQEFGYMTALCGLGRQSNILWCRPERELESVHGAMAVLTFRGFGELEFARDTFPGPLAWVENDQHRERSRTVALAVMQKESTLLFEEHTQHGTQGHELFFDGGTFSFLGNDWRREAA